MLYITLNLPYENGEITVHLQVMMWHTNGLPRDKLSTENATFVSRARKWPLFIDPQGQAGR